MQGQVTVQGTIQDGVLTVTVRGELDAATAPELSRYLARALLDRPRLVVFDLSGVGFMDCAAAAALIRTSRALPGRPRPILCYPRPVVLRLLSLTGLDVQCAIRSESGTSRVRSPTTWFSSMMTNT
jgi:anti-anti-sigma factor